MREQQRELSGNQFRKRCRGEYLHVLRVREWQDLVGQLRQRGEGGRRALNQTPAEPDEIHRALLAGPARRTSGCKRPARARASYRVRRARGALRALPRLGARAQAAGLGDGRRAGRDDAAVGPHGRAHRPGVDRAARRPPRPRARTASRAGTASAARSSRRARDAVRPADRRRPHGRLRAHRSGASRASCSSASALVERDWDDAPRVLRRQRAADGGGRGAGGPRAPRATCSPTRRSLLRLLRRARAGRASCPARLRALVARRAPARPGAADAAARAAA